MKSIRKAVFPVAGLGTRFLPATKASPKEMLPIVDKPLIQYGVEEAIEAGVRQMVFVTSSSKRAIEDHFDRNAELEQELEERGKKELLKMVQSIVPPSVSCIYIRQPQALGLGHAVLCAKPVIGDEPFAVILADDLIDGEDSSCLSQMVKLFSREQSSIVAVEKIPKEESYKYGIIEPTSLYERVFDVKNIVEKPNPENAPSNLAVVGRYLLSAEIFNYLEHIPRGTGGEIQLTDAIDALLKDRRVLGYEFRGRRYDCGSKLGYLQATVDYALKHPEVATSFREFLQQVF
ncbi:MAG: UTP--glucose-phosphate uridylyltransferase GalU [Pseudomonadota bacterium]|jgi:UTP--glucose-1-phosphate uridylyltransferase